MGQNCNLAIEFNGLVSKGVNRKIGPFYILKTYLIITLFHLYYVLFVSHFIKTILLVIN